MAKELCDCQLQIIWKKRAIEYGKIVKSIRLPDVGFGRNQLTMLAYPKWDLTALFIPH